MPTVLWQTAERVTRERETSVHKGVETTAVTNIYQL